MLDSIPKVGEEYAEYYGQYIRLANDVPLLDSLVRSMEDCHSFFESIPMDKQEFRYEEDKWTPKEILLHLIDTERVFANRALWFARSEKPELPGFDQDVFVSNSEANSRTMEDLLDEYMNVRKSTLHLFRSFSASKLLCTGIASGNQLSVRAAGYIIAGHDQHHLGIIAERYL